MNALRVDLGFLVVFCFLSQPCLKFIQSCMCWGERPSITIETIDVGM